MRLHQAGDGAASAVVPGSEPRERNADATRADLLRAAKRRFTVFGFERTTVREIAADAGANVSLINRYFGSKDGLLAAVLADTAHVLDGTAVGESRSVTANIVDDLLTSLESTAWPEFGHVHPLLLLVRDVDGDAATAELRRNALLSTVERFAADITRDGRGSDDTQLRATVLLALVTGIVSLHSALPDNAIDAAHRDHVYQVLSEVVAVIKSAPRA